MKFLLTAVLAFSLFLSACTTPPVSVAVATQAGSFPTALPTQPAVTQASPTQAVPPTDTPAAAATSTTSAASPTNGVTFDYTGIAQNVSIETVPAVAESAGGPYWDVLPQYTRLTLQGYPVTNHLVPPQIFVYPAKDLAGANAGAGRIAADLQALLQNQQVGKNLPFMPLYNAAQVIHARVKFFDFKNGKGVSYLTQFDQAVLPINNHELIYTFQGLTSDGKYYIAAVLPVTHPSLPADEKLTEQQYNQLSGSFTTYLATTVAGLEQQPTGSFTPDLAKLDAMMQSLEVK